MSRARIAGLLALLGLAAFALFGGEYGSFDWLTLRRQVADERAAARDLQAELDSLARVTRALENDSAAQERAAREEFGMIRDGELLYRVVPAQDSGAAREPGVHPKRP